MFLLSLNGCGHKADPYYLQKAPQSDNNVEFIIKKPTTTVVKDNNESCK
jgi:predicted small lipoprotein YifL